jgi:DNA-binding transcriptional LysR family regulator
MELRHLRYFVAVAEELHFGRAAERIHIAQPPLSQQIRQLEEEIGVKLFHRTKRRVQLTHAGQIFMEEALQILAHSEKAVRLARRADRGEIGRLVMGFVGSMTYKFLPSALRSFRDQFPDVELRLRELTSDQQIKALRDRTIDVGFLRQPIKDDALSVETVLREPLILALAVDHVLVNSEHISLDMLAKEPFVMVSRKESPTFYDRIMGLCQSAGFSPRVVQEAIQMPTILSLVSVGIGVTLVPESFRNLQVLGVTYRALTGIGLNTELAVAWRRNDDSPVLLAFLNVVREMALRHEGEDDLEAKD